MHGGDREESKEEVLHRQSRPLISLIIKHRHIHRKKQTYTYIYRQKHRYVHRHIHRYRHKHSTKTYFWRKWKPIMKGLWIMHDRVMCCQVKYFFRTPRVRLADKCKTRLVDSDWSSGDSFNPWSLRSTRSAEIQI